MTEQISTYFGLLAEFGGRAHVPLSEIAPRYLGIDSRKAEDRARLHRLPIPTFRLGSQKSPRLVSMADLAAWIDEQRAAAKAEWEGMR